MLADCRFPVDPARPDPALAALGGSVIDWGPVTRREVVLGTGPDGEQRMAMYEVDGARGRYRLDGDAAVDRVGALDAALGDLVVVCPFALPPVAEVDHRTLPPGWRTPTPPIYAFAPSAVVPRIATDLAALAPLHVPDGVLTRLTADRPAVPLDRAYLVWARPRGGADGARWDMGGWTLDATDLRGAELLAAGRALWLVVDRPRFEDAGGRRRAILRGVVALRRLLD